MTLRSPLHDARNWHKSSYSNENGCVEVGSVPGIVGVRDSKLPGSSPVLTFTTQQWRSFTRAVTDGAIDK